MEDRIRGHGYELYKKQAGTQSNRLFRARVVYLWNDLDEKTAAVDPVEKSKRKLSEFGG